MRWICGAKRPPRTRKEIVVWKCLAQASIVYVFRFVYVSIFFYYIYWTGPFGQRTQGPRPWGTHGSPMTGARGTQGPPRTPRGPLKGPQGPLKGGTRWASRQENVTELAWRNTRASYHHMGEGGHSQSSACTFRTESSRVALNLSLPPSIIETDIWPCAI